MCGPRHLSWFRLFGPEDAAYLLHLTGKLIGMQYSTRSARGFSAPEEIQERLRRSCARCLKRRAIWPTSPSPAASPKSGNRRGN